MLVNMAIYFTNMAIYTTKAYVIRFTAPDGTSWFDFFLFGDYNEAVAHAYAVSAEPGFCSSYSVESVAHWLDRL